MKFEYVFSGVNFSRIHPQTYFATPEVAHIVTDIVTDTNIRIQQNITKILDMDSTLALMFNAFTEGVHHGPHFNKYNNFGSSKLYSDSGGLQVVTVGAELNADMRRTIYKAQCESDIAMCFDEIPVTKVSDGIARTNPKLKLYHPEMNAGCAKRTAYNVKEQVESIASINDTTNIMYIIQFNEVEDAIVWFDAAMNVLEKKHWDRICGLSIAGTSCGGGMLESIDQTIVFHTLKEMYGKEIVKSHLHLLGVGSASRMVPWFYLSQLFDDDQLLSFDSSTLSSSFAMGKFLGDDGKLIDSRKDANLIFDNFIENFSDIFLKHFPEDVVFGSGRQHFVDNIRSISDITKVDQRCEISSFGKAIVPAIVFYQTEQLMKKLKSQIETPEVQQEILLKQVNSLADLKQWRSDYGRFVGSNRVPRKGDTLDDLFK